MKDISYLFALSPGNEDRLRVEAILEFDLGMSRKAAKSQRAEKSET